jgi:hypothetical protein
LHTASCIQHRSPRVGGSLRASVILKLKYGKYGH